MLNVFSGRSFSHTRRQQRKRGTSQQAQKVEAWLLYVGSLFKPTINRMTQTRSLEVGIRHHLEGTVARF